MQLDEFNAKISEVSHLFPRHWNVTCGTTVNHFPFVHMVIDNFFTDEEFNEIKKHEHDVSSSEVKIAHSLMRKNGEIKSDIFDKGFLKAIDEAYFPALQSILGVLSAKKTQYYEFSDFHLISTGPNYKHQIHDDIPKKLLSVVVYINPESNNGTFIHDGRYNETPVGEVEWKQNRAFIFSRLDRATWHSYAANEKDKRYCVIYNLNTDKSFKAHWAEGNVLKFLEKRIKNE
ncbi:hypothetical protein IB286_10665 [Spongiibacter sp. KMU-158]|uniref:2OG-Fe(II) oxygenase n=1 Tax=Spongiibacter pelagi TaxID=2760804 RepID=A0A927C4J7_9GAMM|nr:hypothetical protein [Spongiibacter pelagi]MBD2859466.1 hypothetical protein [Spongiibacter pelagi]